MTKKVIIIVLIILSGLGVYYLTRPSYSSIKTGNKQVSEKSFKWGIGFDPAPTGVHTTEILDQVLQKDSDLGMGWLRMEISNQLADPFTPTDPVIYAAEKKGFRVIIALQPDAEKDFVDSAYAYKVAYERAYNIAKHYSEIDYFQIANEPAGYALKDGWPGISDDSFIDAKYQKMLFWLRGASDGIAKANKNAKRIITGHWLHFGFFQMLIKDKLNFEIVGWDWHQKSSDLTKVENQGVTYNLIDELKKLNKELWITEAGLIEGSSSGEDQQADYLNKLARQVYNSRAFKGFFAFTLYDGIPQNGSNSNLGIVKLEKKGNEYILGQPKEAYRIYQTIIKELSQ